MSDPEFAELYDESGCGASPKLMFEHDKMLKDLTKDMKEVLSEVKKFNTITILNGDNGTTPTTFDREDYFQMMYNRTSKHKFDSVSTFAKKMQPILYLVLVVIFLYFAFATEKNSERTDKLQKAIEKIVQP